MMTPPTDTPELEDCPAFLVFEVRAASGVRILTRMEAVCTRGRHPAGTIHHGTVRETGELVKWRAEPLPATTPQLTDPVPLPADHPITPDTPAGREALARTPAKRPGRPRKNPT